MVIAPDEGSKDRCTLAANLLKVPVHVMKKVRIDGRTVETSSGQINVKGSTAVILDDIISTGGTIATAANILREGGAERVFAACTHGLFIEDAANRLRVCDDILSSDGIEVYSNNTKTLYVLVGDWLAYLSIIVTFYLIFSGFILSLIHI